MVIFYGFHLTSSVADRRPSPLLSNNPFRNRISSASPSPPPAGQSQNRVSTNPFLDTNELATSPNRSTAPVNGLTESTTTSPEKKTVTENTRELFVSKHCDATGLDLTVCRIIWMSMIAPDPLVDQILHQRTECNAGPRTCLRGQVECFHQVTVQLPPRKIDDANVPHVPLENWTSSPIHLIIIIYENDVRAGTPKARSVTSLPRWERRKKRRSAESDELLETSVLASHVGPTVDVWTSLISWT